MRRALPVEPTPPAITQQQVFELLEQHTKLPQVTRELSERIEALTDQLHQKVGALSSVAK